jgi:hypothetical protein
MMAFTKEYTPQLGLDICRDVFTQLHMRGLSDEETLATCMLLAALAAKTIGLPKRGSIDALKATMILVDRMSHDPQG